MAEDRFYAQFSIRRVGDRRPWREMHTAATPRKVTKSTATMIAQVMASFADTYEVRWNIYGSQQGHYVPGHDAARIKHRAGGQKEPTS